jgi:hypothetical protein
VTSRTAAATVLSTPFTISSLGRISNSPLTAKHQEPSKATEKKKDLSQVRQSAE